MLEDARDRAERLVCLGDAVQGGAQPTEVLDRLAELACPVVLGKAGAFLLDVDAGREPASDQFLDVREWTMSHPALSHLDQIRRTQPLLDIHLCTLKQLVLLASHT